jgi:hypothetical protein
MKISLTISEQPNGNVDIRFVPIRAGVTRKEILAWRALKKIFSEHTKEMAQASGADLALLSNQETN